MLDGSRSCVIRCPTVRYLGTSDAYSRTHIEKGRALFKSRVTPEIFGLNIYDRAIVDVMIKSKGNVKSRIW